VQKGCEPLMRPAGEYRFTAFPEEKNNLNFLDISIFNKKEKHLGF
jgi:hypothetical protein